MRESKICLCAAVLFFFAITASLCFALLCRQQSIALFDAVADGLPSSSARRCHLPQLIVRENSQASRSMMSQSHFGRQMRQLPGTKKESAAQRNSSSRRIGSRSVGASNATKSQSHQTRLHQKNRPPKENNVNYQPSGGAQPPFSATQGSVTPPGPGTSIHLPSNDEQIEMSQLSMEEWGGVDSLSQESSASGANLGQDSVSSTLSQQQQQQNQDRGIAPFNRCGGRPPAYRAIQQQQKQRMPPARNMNLISGKQAFNPTAWGPLRLKGALISVPPSLAGPPLANQFLPRFQQQPRTMTFHQAIQQQANGAGSSHSLFGSVAPAQQFRMPSSSSSNGRTAAPPNSFGSYENSMNSNSNSSSASLGSFNSYSSHARGPSQNTTATSNNNNNGARSLSQNSHQSKVYGDPYQSSIHTQSTASSIETGGSFAASQPPPIVMDKHTIQALIDKTLNSRFAAKTTELDLQQRGFHQRLVCAEEEQEAGLATLRKTIADGLDTLQKTAAEAEANLQKSSVDNVAALHSQTSDFATLAEDALKRHEKLAQETEVKASHVDKLCSKVTALVQKAETSALQVKQLAKSSVSAITLARDDFQKMVGSFLKGSTSPSSSSTVSSKSLSTATVKAIPDVVATKGSKTKTTSKKPTSARAPTRSSAKKDLSSHNSGGKNRKVGTAAVTKTSSKAKHKVVGARTPLAALKITTTRSSSSSKSSKLPQQQQPSSPDPTIASCVTPTSHKECYAPSSAGNNFGTPRKQAVAGAASKSKPKAVKATRAKKRGRYGRNIAPSSSVGFGGFTDDEDNESFGFLS